MYSVVKRLLVGRPLASTEEEHQRISKKVGLAVFSSDAISSTAYATEEILHVLVPFAAMAALGYLLPISLVVVVMLAIVVFSYRQTVHAYPNGGGSYVVSRDNLGEAPSLVAGASLLVDYILTVAVSISAGVAAITSAYPGLREHRVALGLAIIAGLALANLRGLRESGRLFAVPTYAYITTLGALVGWGLFRSYTGALQPLPVEAEALAEFTGEGTALTGVTLFVLMRAFSSGAVALTGVEAISDGVAAFRRPVAHNAAVTLAWMAAVLGGFFFGISLLAQRLQPTLSGSETVLSTLGAAVFGRGPVYLLLQASTAAILLLAANTAFADFPRVCSFIARDGYLPRQLAHVGDRLVYSNGVIGLAVAAGGLLAFFGGVTTALIPLYAVGVFTSFTLSQTGMVRRHQTHRQRGWQASAIVNGVGAAATAVVLVVVVVSKFTIGAWLPAVVIPAVVLLFKLVHHHYEGVRASLATEPDWTPPPVRHTVIVLVGHVHRGVLQALQYAKALNPSNLVAVSVVINGEEEARIREIWSARHIDAKLETVRSPYREITRPLLEYIDEVDAQWDDDLVTVIIPEFVVHHWWAHVLHNQSALALKARLLFRRNTVVISVPCHVD